MVRIRQTLFYRQYSFAQPEGKKRLSKDFYKRSGAASDLDTFNSVHSGLYHGLDIQTGFGMLDHMLTLTAFWAGMDLHLRCRGDLHIDAHHSAEDIGLVLGQAVLEALGDRVGIARVGYGRVPMDEALILCAVDISGRGGCYYDVSLPTEKVGDFDTQLGQEFMEAFAYNSGVTLHLRQLAGRNSHHILEGCFKALARALRQAVSLDPACADEIPSTKGLLA